MGRQPLWYYAESETNAYFVGYFKGFGGNIYETVITLDEQIPSLLIKNFETLKSTTIQDQWEGLFPLNEKARKLSKGELKEIPFKIIKTPHWKIWIHNFLNKIANTTHLFRIK